MPGTTESIMVVVWTGREIEAHKMSDRGLASTASRVSHGTLHVVSLPLTCRDWEYPRLP